ncbi:unconventional myosin-IXa isoform X3 [Petromyzon marinus]|uniref:unconventional myosin-IXa isoform X3 n=1 Tax=Petromyzon marinus TaxID=7757 RepID=UPI003F72D354
MSITYDSGGGIGGNRLNRLEREECTLRIYPGVISEDTIYCPVLAQRGTTAAEVIQTLIEKLHLERGTCYVLAEVKESGGEEWILNPTDCPAQRMLLWPRRALDEQCQPMKSREDYRFLLREKNMDGSIRYEGPLDSWMKVTEERRRMVERGFLPQPPQQDYDDLCRLPDLNERTLLDNLRVRFKQEKIYTYVGTILIAVNPFKFLPIYNPKYVRLYDNRELGKQEPHIFAVADTTYHAMLRQKTNQCIVISGESGSGKTQSTNFLIHHLTALSQKGYASGVEQTILGAGPVLEAFGNAKTAHNNNSSRFGKFIQVNYWENGIVRGAVVEKYLLEKSRLVSQETKERNYHVFYYLLAGATQEEREEFQLKQPEEYQYLNQVGKKPQQRESYYNDDTPDGCFTEGEDLKHDFKRLQLAMEMVGFLPATRKRIFMLLSAILHLGNISYKKKPYRDEAVEVATPDVLSILSNLLQVKEEMLTEALTTRKTMTAGEKLILPYKLTEAVTARDSMAKSLYSALFDWIVLRINHALLYKMERSEHVKGLSIGVLDIFGFEDFENNSFEQFCINYANECLQYYFNQHVFKIEQEEYQKEGILWNTIDYTDNLGCINLISKKPTGLLHLLDEECNFPQATNETLLAKFRRQHDGNKYYESTAVMEPAFIIKHYAGRVKYCIKDFREKNTDHMRPDIVALLRSSESAFVRSLISIDPVAVFRWAVLRAFFRAAWALRALGKNATESLKPGGTGGVSPRAQSTLARFSLLHHPVHQRSLEMLQRFKEDTDSMKRNSRILLADIRRGSSGDKPHRFFNSVDQCQEAMQKTQPGAGLRGCASWRADSEDAEFFAFPAHSKLLERVSGILTKGKNVKSRQSIPKHLLDVNSLKHIVNLTLHDRTTKSLLHLNKKKKPPSISAQFQTSLNKLMETLDHADPFFIRCIRSNADKMPLRFDEKVVLRQLRYTGMLETVHIRQAGYSVRYSFKQFAQVFYVLMPHNSGESKEDITNFLETMRLNPRNFQIGHAKVFMKESERKILAAALHTAVLSRITLIQGWFRAALERRRFLRARQAASTIQACWRRYRLCWRIVRLQAACRGFVARKRYKILLEQNKKEDIKRQNNTDRVKDRQEKWTKRLETRNAQTEADRKHLEKTLGTTTPEDEGRLFAKGGSPTELADKGVDPLRDDLLRASSSSSIEDENVGESKTAVSMRDRPKSLPLEKQSQVRAKRLSRRQRELEQADYSLGYARQRSGDTLPSVTPTSEGETFPTSDIPTPTSPPSASKRSASDQLSPSRVLSRAGFRKDVDAIAPGQKAGEVAARGMSAASSPVTPSKLVLPTPDSESSSKFNITEQSIGQAEKPSSPTPYEEQRDLGKQSTRSPTSAVSRIKQDGHEEGLKMQTPSTADAPKAPESADTSVRSPEDKAFDEGRPTTNLLQKLEERNRAMQGKQQKRQQDKDEHQMMTLIRQQREALKSERLDLERRGEMMVRQQGQRFRPKLEKSNSQQTFDDGFFYQGKPAPLSPPGPLEKLLAGGSMGQRSVSGSLLPLVPTDSLLSSEGGDYSQPLLTPGSCGIQRSHSARVSGSFESRTLPSSNLRRVYNYNTDHPDRLREKAQRWRQENQQLSPRQVGEDAVLMESLDSGVAEDVDPSEGSRESSLEGRAEAGRQRESRDTLSPPTSPEVGNKSDEDRKAGANQRKRRLAYTRSDFLVRQSTEAASDEDEPISPASPAQLPHKALSLQDRGAELTAVAMREKTTTAPENSKPTGWGLPVEWDERYARVGEGAVPVSGQLLSWPPDDATTQPASLPSSTTVPKPPSAQDKVSPVRTKRWGFGQKMKVEKKGSKESLLQTTEQEEASRRGVQSREFHSMESTMGSRQEWHEHGGAKPEDLTKPTAEPRPPQPPSPAAPVQPKVQRRKSLKISNLLSSSAQSKHSDAQVISSHDNLRQMIGFLQGKINDLLPDDGKNIDGIFKEALKEFRKNLEQTNTRVTFYNEDICMRHKDLISNFEQVLDKTVRQRPYVTDKMQINNVCINLFSGFMVQFMGKCQALDDSNVIKAPKNERKKKRKKESDGVVEHNGHQFRTVQFNIPSFCEACATRIWIMDRGYVCRACKFACHKKCYSSTTRRCTGYYNANKKAGGDMVGKQFAVDLFRLTGPDRSVPFLLEKLLNYIEIHGLYTEGIYRKSGANTKVKELRQQLDNDVNSVNLDDYQVHVIGSVLKQWLRELPVPLMTLDLYDEFLRAVGVPEKKEKIKAVYSIIGQLPSVNYSTLERIIFHLVRIAQYEDTNRMSCNALAIVFAPCILRPPDTTDPLQSMRDIGQTTHCVELLVEEQMRKFKTRFADISTLESVENSANQRLSLIRRSMGKGRYRQSWMRGAGLKDAATGTAQPGGTSVGDKIAEEGESDCATEASETNDLDESTMEEEEQLLSQEKETIKERLSELRNTMISLERSASDDDALDSSSRDTIDGTDEPSKRDHGHAEFRWTNMFRRKKRLNKGSMRQESTDSATTSDGESLSGRLHPSVAEYRAHGMDGEGRRITTLTPGGSGDTTEGRLPGSHKPAAAVAVTLRQPQSKHVTRSTFQPPDPKLNGRK